MYRMLGSDQKVYGPVSFDQIAQWIREGRANAATQIQLETESDWKPISAYVEFSTALGQTTGAPAASIPPLTEDPNQLAAEIAKQDYDLDLGACLSNGWNLLMQNFGILFGVSMLFLLVQLVIGVLGAIPIVGILVTLASLAITGPLTAGLYLTFLKVIRGQPAEVSNLFAGFSSRFLQLVLAHIVPALLTTAAVLPGVVLMIIAIVAMGIHSFGVGALVLMLGIVLALVPSVYLGLSWMFTLALTIDQRLDFWPAMQLGRRMVGKHFWKVLFLLLLTGLLNFVGVLCCVVGVLFTIPIAFGALMYGYETIFSIRPSPQLDLAPRTGS